LEFDLFTGAVCDSFLWTGPGFTEGGIAYEAFEGFLCLSRSQITDPAANQVVHVDSNLGGGAVRFTLDVPATQIVQDFATGDVYCLGYNTNVVHRYDSSGSLRNAIVYESDRVGDAVGGMGWDQESGRLLLIDFAHPNRARLYTPDGERVGFLSLEGTRPCVMGIALRSYAVRDRLLLLEGFPENKIYVFEEVVPASP
jgi:hypothetical protein